MRLTLLAVTVAIVLVGTLIAAVVISATSTGPAPDLTSPSAIAVATRRLPPEYVIRPGDTFTSIAAANHLTEVQLQQLNPTQDPTALVPGQKLMLHVRPAAAPTRKRVLPRFWTVKHGDTYFSIAAKLGLHVADLAQFNPTVNPNDLVPGRRLELKP